MPSYVTPKKNTAVRRAEYQRNRARYLARARVRYQERREQALAYQREYYVRNAEKVKARERRKVRAKVAARHGLTVVAFDRLHAEHRHCAICLRPPRTGERLMTDYDHATQVIRGLLCRTCNLALGLFNDNPEWLDTAARYLRDAHAQLRHA